MLVRLKAYRWFIAGIVAVLLALGGAAQAGLISPDIGNQTALTIATALTISNASPEPAIAEFGGSPYAFARMSDNAIWYRKSTSSGWGDWQSLGGGLTSAPAATVRGPVLYVFAKGGDNAIWHIRYDGASWSNWESLGGGLTSAPAAAVNSDTNPVLFVFAKGGDDAIWHRRYDGSSWSNWESLGGVLTSAPAAAATYAPTRAETRYVFLYAKGGDNAIWHRRYDGTSWSDWESLGGVLNSATAAIRGNGKALLFARGTDNAVWYRSFSDTGGWTAWTSLGGTHASGPGVVYRGTMRLFARGSDNVLWYRTAANCAAWGSCAWTDWTRIP